MPFDSALQIHDTKLLGPRNARTDNTDPLGGCNALEIEVKFTVNFERPPTMCKLAVSCVQPQTQSLSDVNVLSPGGSINAEYQPVMAKSIYRPHPHKLMTPGDASIPETGEAQVLIKKKDFGNTLRKKFIVWMADEFYGDEFKQRMECLQVGSNSDFEFDKASPGKNVDPRKMKLCCRILTAASDKKIDKRTGSHLSRLFSTALTPSIIEIPQEMILQRVPQIIVCPDYCVIKEHLMLFTGELPETDADIRVSFEIENKTMKVVKPSYVHHRLALQVMTPELIKITEQLEVGIRLITKSYVSKKIRLILKPTSAVGSVVVDNDLPATIPSGHGSGLSSGSAHLSDLPSGGSIEEEQMDTQE